jgi:hypothetical protein
MPSIDAGRDLDAGDDHHDRNHRGGKWLHAAVDDAQQQRRQHCDFGRHDHVDHDDRDHDRHVDVGTAEVDIVGDVVSGAVFEVVLRLG